jgi:YidC/Oxa1 family membrane protein insertase
MRQNVINVAIFLVLAVGLGIGWNYGAKYLFPEPPPVVRPPVKPAKEPAAAVGGFAALAAGPHAGLKSLPQKSTEAPKPAPAIVAPAPSKPAEPHTLIALGNDDFKKKVLLSTLGAGVQQVVLRDFEEADRVGKMDKDKVTGKPRPLHIIPGFIKDRSHKVTVPSDHIDLEAGPVTNKSYLTEPSYTIFHYPTKGDSLYRDDDPDAGKYPLPDLGRRTWKVVKDERPADGKQTVAFETELDAPYYVKLRKTFTLEPGHYHLGFTIDIDPLPARVKGAPAFRYQIAGPRGLPIEGEWYTQTYRNAYVGKQDLQRPTRIIRDIEDAGTINNNFGGEAVPKASTKLLYAAIGTQYFASALAVDVRNPEAGSPLAYVRPTREIYALKANDIPYVDDITFRAVLEPLEMADGKPVSHHFIVYDGPIKIQLLGQLAGKETVDPDLVTYYADELGLVTMTDHHSPYFFGRFANAIYWADAVIAMTNVMHRVLGWLHGLVPIWGLNIIMLTVIVRLCLMFFSRKQQVIGAKAQAKMAALQPEIERLKAKHEGDPQEFNRAKTKLFLEQGVLNPKAQMFGCLLLLAQMPVFMGLYFCLQESVFFRLSPFLWMNNLAAPDMLIYWSESIPIISDPANRTGFFSFLYLGPYFNLLPIISVTLMFIHTKLTMPPATDEMQEQQQKMMKFMMAFMGLFFYKIAAGLALYFICSTTWGLIERKLIPKPKVQPYEPTVKPAVGSNGKVGGPPVKKTGFMARLMEKVEEAQKMADQQRQIRNDPKQQGRDKKKKR